MNSNLFADNYVYVFFFLLHRIVYLLFNDSALWRIEQKMHNNCPNRLVDFDTIIT